MPYNRRDILKMLFGTSAYLGMSPFNMFLNSFVNKLFSQELGDEIFDKNFLCLTMYGAPPRWLYDCPLTPNGASDFLASNPMVMTRFDQGSGLGRYDCIPTNGFEMPLLWDKLMPTVSSGNLKMSTLLENMIMIRGVTMPSSNHSAASASLFNVNSASETLSGVIANNSTRPLQALNFRKNIAHYSKKGVGMTSMSSSQWPPDVMIAPFVMTNSLSLSSYAVDILDQTLSAMEARIDARNFKRKSLRINRIDAHKAFLKNMDDLIVEYPSIEQKYKDLIVSAYNLELGQGIDRGDFLEIGSIIPSGGNSHSYYRMHNVSDSLLPIGFNFADTLVDSNPMPDFARSLAVGEFVIKHKISSFFSGLAFGPKRYNINGQLINFNLDSHETGALSTLFMTSKYFQGISACLNELKSVFIENNIFDKTIIQLQAEFGRNSRLNGEGSDHGANGNNITLFSGLVKKLQITGHLEDDNLGSWGKAANSKMESEGILGGRITCANIVASNTKALELSNPHGNAESLLKTENGELLAYFSGKSFQRETP